MGSTTADETRTALAATLTEGIVQLTSSPQWERYLAFQAAFHAYSFGNVVLIAAQRPSATQVAGFSTWKSLGRWVRRGESAIWILAPVQARATERDVDGGDEIGDCRRRKLRVTAFRRVAVFDVAQTDGAQIPQVVWRLTGADGSGAFPLLIAYASSIGYSVEDATLDGISNGDCDFEHRRIRVEVANHPAQRTKTLVHELAHAVLHEHESERALAELEAESVAFVVCRAIGLDTGAYTFGYVASWAGGGDAALAAIRRSGDRISRTAHGIIEVLQRSDVVVVDREIEGEQPLRRTA
jgi:antirestriction protein ArdC